MRNIWKMVGHRAAWAIAPVAALSMLAIAGANAADAIRLQAPDALQVAEASAPSPEETFASVPVTDDDFILGDANAPITIVEYASLTCPHCAHFHNTVLPEIKKAYIDTGKVRLVFRDFPLDKFALAGSMLARCSGPDRYYGFVELLFKDQQRWARANNPGKALAQIARLGGLSQQKFDACLKDEAVQRAVLEQRLAAGRDYKVNSTPTLIINGRKYTGGLSFDQIKSIVEPMLSKS